MRWQQLYGLSTSALHTRALVVAVHHLCHDIERIFVLIVLRAQ